MSKILNVFIINQNKDAYIHQIIHYSVVLIFTVEYIINQIRGNMTFGDGRRPQR